MTLLTRTGLALLGLALATPVAVWADPPASAGNPHNHRRGLFGKQKLCAECQRAKLQAQGINIPPPPSLPAGGVTTEGGVCTACQAGQGMVVSDSAAGYAVVGGDSAPGYAVVGGQVPSADPSPIGVVQGRPSQAPGRSAGTDRSVMQASTMPAPDPVRPAGSNRPRVLSHLFGLSEIGSEYRERKQRLRGQDHASIRYDQPETQRVTDLPASKVYGK
ncbi:hypothetical protein SAMN05444166_4770 [Singulisphaera sp. GP187]|uniref:hypothetical protein n=1 Tax=Singulisphaera sp. GP187 TaxID=1882752 RepID=UPI0009296DB1|nr:hypothetical protein [Singulisphaera sp. GP187]SIO44364.1 hypothetical protein SAMN05444166_4770 [Singulisphaera sp. GP187]